MATGQRRLVWHIGHHKTGSTSIQHTLAAGGVKIDGTLLYTSQHHNYMLPQFRQWAAGQGSRPGTRAQPGPERTAKVLAESDFDLAIFSAEHLEEADPKKFRRVLEEFFLPHVSDLKIVAYVRPHAARTRSSFAERIKIGDYDGTLDKFHEGFRDHLLYAKRLDPWREVFGDLLTVRPMVRDRLHHQSAVHDFMRTALGPDVPFTVTSERRVNESLTLEQLALIQHFRQHAGILKPVLRRQAGRSIGQLLAQQTMQAWSTPLALHRELAERIRDYYLDDARAIDASYFADAPVMEAELHREVAASLDEPQHLDAQTLLSEEVRETMRVMALVFRAVSSHTEVPPPRLFRSITQAKPINSENR